MADIIWHGDKVLENIAKKVRAKLGLAAEEVARTARKNISESARALGYSKPGMFPRRNRGDLFRNILSAVITDDAAIVYVPKGHKYAKRLEVGGYITSAKYMAVPISPEAIRHNQRGGTARTFKTKLTLIKRPGKPALLVQKGRGKSDKRGTVGKHWTIHYLLTKRVYIASRPYLRPSLDQCRAKIVQIFSKP